LKIPNKQKENIRLEALRSYQILDSAAEESFDDITHLASQICDTPIALISLVDTHRQWFKSRVGLDVCETDRELSFCAHNLTGNELLIVPDASEDDRFRSNALVTGDPYIRFYAGAPIINRDGHSLGSVCVIDQKSREITDQQKEILKRLANQTMVLLEARKTSMKLAETIATLETVKNFMTICSTCKKIKIKKGQWASFEEFLMDHKDFDLSHGLCESCYDTQFSEL